MATASTIIEMMSILRLKSRHWLLAIFISASALPVHAANWTINRVNHALLTPPGGVTVAEMSGVTYLGPVAGAHRFIATEETKGELIQFDLTLSAAGGIDSIANVTAIDIVPTSDFEGIAYTNPERNSVFLAAETGAHLREVSLATGAELQNGAVPTLFNNRRGNLGTESLARSQDGKAMWIANEQALTIDGLVSTAVAGTNVRLLKLNVADNATSAGPQYAYHVEPIHGASTLGSPQSGLSDLTLMPDGTLLALERSVAVATPIYLNRIFEINPADATDVSVAPFNAGLSGQTFTPVGKSLLWSGPIDASFGQNMEGLTLGPQLANGDWSLIGVVDNGDGNSGNTIVAFTATPVISADFDADGVVDGADFLQWQRGNGKTIGATHHEGDANRDGAVNGADLELWKGAFSAPPAGGATTAIPEPATISLSIAASLAVAAHKKVRRSARRT
ncbi:MAG: hypothetical protein C0485_06625 [Pirellula sp.]|nr:hypothetical protein [Pirellula sp.]